MYVALKLHFTSESYDYFKFNGKVKTTESKFNVRKDRYFFQKLCNKYNGDMVRDYFVSNFVYDVNSWVGSITRDRGERIYSEWKKKQDSISYLITNEIDYLLDQVDNFDSLFECKQNQHPIILKKYLSKKISLETLIVLDDILNFVNRFDKQISDKLLWPKIKMSMIKYKPFMRCDYKKFKSILKEKVLDRFAHI
jgi:hypothetical protein